MSAIGTLPLQSLAMNSSGSAVLSPDTIKKAEAIEKLARNVKQKMKGNR